MSLSSFTFCDETDFYDRAEVFEDNSNRDDCSDFPCSVNDGTATNLEIASLRIPPALIASNLSTVQPDALLNNAGGKAGGYSEGCLFAEFRIGG